MTSGGFALEMVVYYFLFSLECKETDAVTR